MIVTIPASQVIHGDRIGDNGWVSSIMQDGDSIMLITDHNPFKHDSVYGLIVLGPDDEVEVTR